MNLISKDLEFFTCTEALQLCSCSYGDELLLGFTSKIPGESIQRNFLRYLREDKISFKEERNDFPGCQEEQKQEGKKSLSDFFFPLSCSGGNLWNGQLYDLGYAELVLVCSSGKLLCLACCFRGIYQTEKHFEE